MLTEADIASVDQGSLHKIYEMWPEHFEEALHISVGTTDHDPDYYRSILLCGVGGSATTCDILSDVLQYYGKIPVRVLRGESMPTYTNKRSLVLVNSVSGNTKESIRMMEEASDKGAEVICISSGGLLRDSARKRGHNHIGIPSSKLPRASLPYMVVPELRLVDGFLERSLRKDISTIHRQLSEIRNKISTSSAQKSNVAKKIASFFASGFAFCFSSPSLVSVGTRFKNSLNENAKVHCLTESVLEGSHNEIVPFTYNNNEEFNPKVMLLQWQYDQEIVKERFIKMNSFFGHIKQPVITYTAPQRSLISAMLSSTYILDYATIYMAIARKVDPSPTPAIDILKNLEVGNLKSDGKSSLGF